MPQLRSSFLAIFFLLAALPINAQYHEKKEEKLAASAAPQAVVGGVKFAAAKGYDESYEKTLNYLKKADYTIESANKETGQIVTQMTVKGGYTQTGTRIYAIFIKDGDTATTVRIAVTDQKRKKLVQTEPWGDPKVNDKESQRIADEIKTLLGS
jgi:hypothetical protein